MSSGNCQPFCSGLAVLTFPFARPTSSWPLDGWVTPYHDQDYRVTLTQCQRGPRWNKVCLGAFILTHLSIRYFEVNSYVYFSNWYLEHFQWNWPELSAKEPHWWQVNSGSGNGLLLSDNKPLPKPVLVQFYRPQWVNLLFYDFSNMNVDNIYPFEGKWCLQNLSSTSGIPCCKY